MPPHALSPRAITEVHSLLKQSPGLTPQELLAIAEKDTGPLHSAFEWDDTKAAQAYRLQRAGSMLIRVKVKITAARHSEVRASVSMLPRPPALRVLTSDVAVSATNTNDSRSRDLRQAIAELELFRKKYSMISELSGVFVALEELKDPKKGVLRRAVEAAREHENKGYTRPEAASLAAQAYRLPICTVLEEMRAS